MRHEARKNTKHNTHISEETTLKQSSATTWVIFNKICEHNAKLKPYIINNSHNHIANKCKISFCMWREKKIHVESNRHSNASTTSILNFTSMCVCWLVNIIYLPWHLLCHYPSLRTEHILIYGLAVKIATVCAKVQTTCLCMSIEAKWTNIICCCFSISSRKEMVMKESKLQLPLLINPEKTTKQVHTMTILFRMIMCNTDRIYSN